MLNHIDDQRPAESEAASLIEFFRRYAETYAYAKADGGWCYEDGCVYRGLLELFLATGDRQWHGHLLRLAGAQVSETGELRGYRIDEYNIDNILAGRVLFHLAETEGERFARAADILAEQLSGQPRTGAGSYWHKNIYPQQIWLDGLYMGLPFQIQYGAARNRPELVDDAAAQLMRALDLMADQKSGLFFHGYDDSRAKVWSNPKTGLSQSLWGRAVGWLAMALVDIVTLLPARHPCHDELARRAGALAGAILKHRTADGLWLQVMDRPDLEGNYAETSASAMFGYFLLRLSRLGPDAGHADFAGAGRAAIAEIHRRHIAQGADGAWRMTGICEVAGLGAFRGRERDGSPGYYVSEKIVANDPKGVGPLMMAEAEILRLEAKPLASAPARK